MEAQYNHCIAMRAIAIHDLNLNVALRRLTVNTRWWIGVGGERLGWWAGATVTRALPARRKVPTAVNT